MQHVPPTPAADKLLTERLAQGYDDPALVIEAALSRMAREDASDNEPAYVSWVQEECKHALAQIERGETVPYDLSKIKRMAQENRKKGRKVKDSIIP